MKGTFDLNDHVILYNDPKRKWLKIIQDQEFHCNLGYINLKDIAGVEYGKKVNLNTGKSVYVFPPKMYDWIDFVSHESQIIYQKDAAAIVRLLNAKPGDTIFEAGAGSGALTIILASIVGDKGSVVTHDNREKALKIARKNVKKSGLQNVQFCLKDVINEGFEDGTADSLVLDLVDPWNVVEEVVKVLSPSGNIVIFQPTFNQLERTNIALRESGFGMISTIELIEREIQVSKGAVRPSTRMIGHTGFLTSAKLLS